MTYNGLKPRLSQMFYLEQQTLFEIFDTTGTCNHIFALLLSLFVN